MVVFQFYDFYPRPPRGGRLSSCLCTSAPDRISIHALREEGDKLLYFVQVQFVVFLSTPSARRATREDVRVSRQRRGISIHALREEGDDIVGQGRDLDDGFLSTPSARRATLLGGKLFWMASYFYPRPPRGGRQYRSRDKRGFGTFLSTPSARRATNDAAVFRQNGEFLSTPSARRATHRQLATGQPLHIFLSTPSARRATPDRCLRYRFHPFLSTPSARRATRTIPVFSPGV